MLPLTLLLYSGGVCGDAAYLVLQLEEPPPLGNGRMGGVRCLEFGVVRLCDAVTCELEVAAVDEFGTVRC